MRQLRHHPHEQRHRVAGQLVERGLSQRLPVELVTVLELDRGHAGPSTRTRHLDAEDRRLLDLRMRRDRRLDLRGRDVLALPAERVAESVGERGVPEALCPHQVPRVEPDVALLEGVADQFLLGGFLVGVAVERLEVADLGQQQARLAVLDLVHPAIGTSLRFAGVVVILDERDRAGTDAGRLVDVEDVDERGVAFTGRVELADPFDAEALGELVPDRGPQPVAADDPHLVLAIRRLFRLVEQITADLADVDESGGVVADDVVPELRRRERLAQRQGRTGVQHGRQRDRQRVVVVQRQAAVQRVAAVEPQSQTAESGQRAQPAVVGHDAGLRHAGGAGGEDVEGLVLGQHRLGGGGIRGGRRRRHRDDLVDCQQTAGVRAALGDLVDQIDLGDDDLRLQQPETVLEHLAALVEVDHPRDGATLDGGEHQQHRLGRVAQHDADHVAVPHPLGRQHRGVAVDRLVGLPVRQPLIAELDEHVVAVAGRAVLEDLADRGLGGRPGTEPGDHSAQNRRGVFEETGELFGDVEDSDAAARPTHFICPSIHVVMSVLSSSGRLSDTLVAADAGQRVGAHAASAASTSSTTMRRRSASSAT